MTAEGRKSRAINKRASRTRPDLPALPSRKERDPLATTPTDESVIMSTEGLDEYRANAACEDPARYLTREQAKAEIKVVFCAYAHEHADSTEAQECERTCPEHQSKFCSCTADLTDPRI